MQLSAFWQYSGKTASYSFAANYLVFLEKKFRLRKISIEKTISERKTLHFFREEPFLIYLNSNEVEGKNLLAIGGSNVKMEGDWKFGFVSYDYKNSIENLSSDNHDGVGFPEMNFFTPDLMFQMGDRNVEVYFNPVRYTEDEIYNLVSEFQYQEIEETDFEEIYVRSRISKDTYIHNVKALKNHIQRGDIYEVNYCQEFFSEQVDIDPLMYYFKLNELSPTPYSCFMKHEDKYLISASPERFIRKKGDRIVSEPIKGTIRRGTDEQEDEELKNVLQNDRKERSENIMIVDLVRNDLSKIAKKGSVKVDELCGIYTFPQVHQMISTVSAELKPDVDFDDIIRATFPMGSMTGAPKIRAMELIEEYEETKRGLYSGTVGYIDPEGDFDFNVIIRSLIYNRTNKYLSFIVGGAITSLSDPEKEYEECLLKAKAMLNVLKGNA